MSGPALAIMARAPIAGQAKTRLQPHLGADGAATLYSALLMDTIDVAVSVPIYSTFIAFTPSGARGMFRSFAPGPVDLIPQTGADLGERMLNVMREIEARGHSPVVVIGSDVPFLPARVLTAALASLQKSDMCLGPASDGGYYLIGMRRLDHRIFSAIPWSTASVLEATKRRARSAGLTVAFLDELQDIDRFGDLLRLPAARDVVMEAGCSGLTYRVSIWLKENEGLLIEHR